MRDFLKLALLALLIALPASWLLANYWLSDFAFRTDLGIGSFVGASLLLLAVVMLTSLYHTQKISRIDPVDALRQE
jgi:putative ABC transport system permease protein